MRADGQTVTGNNGAESVMKFGGNINETTTVLKLNNGTLIRIYQNVSSLLLEIGSEAQSLLIQLNQTTNENDRNVSALALAVLERPAENDLLKKYRLYYVQLADDQTTGIRLYWKSMIDYLRGQMSTAVRTMWTPVSYLGRIFRYSNNNSNNNKNNSPLAGTNNNIMVVGIMPYFLKAVDLPDKMEHRILDLSTIDDNGQSTERLDERLTMRPISAFNGRLPSNADRLTLAKQGVVVTDKAVRILFIGEQLADGTVDIFPLAE